jgi:pimeloyl-ACP methyl ester carboxylesterase
MSKLRVLSCALLFLASSGCSSAVVSPAPERTLEVAIAARAPFIPVATWSACALTTESADASAECASVDVPLDWSVPAGEKISIFVKRVRATGMHGALRPNAAASYVASGVIWLLGESPGSSGVELESMAHDLLDKNTGIDVYLPDPRGTGRSTKLACPQEESPRSPGGIAITTSEWVGCLGALREQWGARLSAFRTTESAYDLSAISAATATSGQSIFFYGRGYGSYLAARVVAVSATKPSAVIMDSPCLPGACYFSQEDAWYADAGKRLMRACADEPFCRSKLGSDPWARVGEALDVLDAGGCKALANHGIDRLKLRVLLASYLRNTEKRALVPAIAYRILRCDDGDARALAKFATDRNGPERIPAAIRYRSQALATHVIFSELSETAHLGLLDPSAYFDPSDRLVAGDLEDTWPRYVDPLAQSWPAGETRTLLMSGSLDPASSLREDLVQRHWPSARVVSFAGSTGGAASDACGLTVLGDFLAHKGAAADTSCVAGVPEVSFTGSPGLARTVFGTQDLWEN